MHHCPPQPADLYNGPCLHCGGTNHEKVGPDQRECWNCFETFVVPQDADLLDES